MAERSWFLRVLFAVRGAIAYECAELGGSSPSGSGDDDKLSITAIGNAIAMVVS